MAGVDRTRTTIGKYVFPLIAAVGLALSFVDVVRTSPIVGMSAPLSDTTRFDDGEVVFGSVGNHSDSLQAGV
ncbi:hypothetical protein [Nocardia sp. R7R-8]|uniref:hypothetical protein n=1 Tax=Nocardia sp. R7R-8 TaxID=3459304 RepID=UPI00403D97DC